MFNKNKYLFDMSTAMGIDKKQYSEKDLYSNFPFTRTIPESRGIHHEHINKYGFRSDNFKTIHNKMHIVFCGCSMTWGTGLNLEEIWAKQVYNFINKNTECSGFFNLGSPGTSFTFQLFNLFKYFKNYGNPSLIIFNIPSTFRFYNYDIENKNIVDAIYDKSSPEVFNLLTYHLYMILEHYCLTNNINLISFSYDSNTEQLLSSFLTFYKINQEEIESNLLKYTSENIQDKLIAKDNSHPGVLFHNEWTKKVLDIIKKENIL